MVTAPGNTLLKDQFQLSGHKKVKTTEKNENHISDTLNH